MGRKDRPSRKYVENKTGVFNFKSGYYWDTPGTDNLSAPYATYKILDAMLQQARTHPKGLSSLPIAIQKHIASIIKN